MGLHMQTTNMCVKVGQSLFSNTGPLTLHIVYMMSAENLSNMWMFSQFQGLSNATIHFYENFNTKFNFTVGFNGTDLSRVQNDSVNPGVGTMCTVQVTWDGTNDPNQIHIYTNGSEKSYLSGNTGTGVRGNLPNAPVYVGGQSFDDVNFQNAWRGYIYSAAGWDVVLNSSELVQLERSRTKTTLLQVRPSNQVFCYWLDEAGEGISITGSNKIIDRSKSKNHGNAINGPVGKADMFYSYQP